MTGLFDSFSRQICYMRISVTDHCNLRCIYCKAKSVPHLSRDDILSYEEIQKVARAAAGLGIRALRLTGGEPLLRSELSRLVSMLVQIEGIEEIMLTTNGILLGKYAFQLKEAGLKRVNISLDSLDKEKFRYITGSNSLKDVLMGIEAARKANLDPVKINMVVLKSINDNEVLDFARRSLDDAWNVRFIEYIPIGMQNNEDTGLATIGEMMQTIEQSLGQLEPCWPKSGFGPAKYYRLPGAEGTLGFIGAMSDCFCERCSRLRLTADGALMPCLLDDAELDIKQALRSGAIIDELQKLIEVATAMKKERHHLLESIYSNRRQMWQIGG